MEYVLAGLKTALRVLVFVAGLVLVIIGQRHIGYPGLLLMLGGLALMLLVLFAYNQRNK